MGGITDMDMDMLIEIASKLDPQDAAKLALTCHRLKEAAYSYPVWESRELFLARHQLKFSDRSIASFHLKPYPLVKPETFTQILIYDHQNVILAQASRMYKFEIRDSVIQSFTNFNCPDMKAQINCMRLYGRNESKVLVTSSYDSKIRIWRKDALQLTLRGRSGPSTVLAHGLVGRSGDGDGLPPVMASGGGHGQVHLWSLPSHNTRGKSYPIARLRVPGHGQDSHVIDLAVAKHNSSLLVSLGLDSYFRVWDAQSERCVGCTGVVADSIPLGIRWGEAEAVCYVGCGSSVIGIDMRSMEVTGTLATHRPDIVAFQAQQYSSLICSGGTDETAKLWDIRRSSTRSNPVHPVAVLGNHFGPVKCIHVDCCKVVSGGQGDRVVNVWDAKTGEKLVSLDCTHPRYSEFGVCGMAVKGTSIVTATSSPVFNQHKLIMFRDYSNSNQLLPSHTRHS